ncbi:hypothetical protein Tsubulata_035896 [Turnera subulata]|uniref:Uncharacterized protein n=1 Tax=Turnera subulata TaxID=218843 RepID=A0A9Q0FCR8_9ROSI|nr:hypothetical protein Tsubulata_035896 [Turnera subulata]
MASAIPRDCSHHGESGNKTRDVGVEEEEELFEINLEAVNSIPPPHYWESYFTATRSALLANCLLPIADVSCAVPASPTACNTLSLPLPLPLPQQLMLFGLHSTAPSKSNLSMT